MLRVAAFCLVVIGCGGCVALSKLARGYAEHPAYSVRVTLRFNLGGKSFVATRYADVVYLTGGDISSGVQFSCPAAGDPGCTYRATSTYFVGLPDGNIADAQFDNRFSETIFGGRGEGEVRHFLGRIYQVQSNSAPADSRYLSSTQCPPMAPAAMFARYGNFPPHETGYPVDFTFQRLRKDEPVGRVDDFEDIVHGPACGLLIKRTSRDVIETDLNARRQPSGTATAK